MRAGSENLSIEKSRWYRGVVVEKIIDEKGWREEVVLERSLPS